MLRDEDGVARSEQLRRCLPSPSRCWWSLPGIWGCGGVGCGGVGVWGCGGVGVWGCGGVGVWGCGGVGVWGCGGGGGVWEA